MSTKIKPQDAGGYQQGDFVTYMMKSKPKFAWKRLWLLASMSSFMDHLTNPNMLCQFKVLLLTRTRDFPIVYSIEKRGLINRR